MIAPGEWLGVLGGGQLGRMFTMAAHRLGYRVMVLDPDPSSPAGAVADRHVCAALHDPLALSEMARTCAAATVETENVPLCALQFLEHRVVVSPSARCVEIAQDRIREKSFVCGLGLSPAPYVAVNDISDLEGARIAPLLPAVLKLSRLGYDGRGQLRVATAAEARCAFEQLGRAPCVLERHIDLLMELSVLLARGGDGRTALWPVIENHHRNGILDMSVVPARAPEPLAMQARNAAVAMAEAIDYRGVLCVEFFVDRAGSLLINEFAPRPHNSGHATLDASRTCQFEQQVRTLAGLPLGDTSLSSPAVMQNVLGDLWENGTPQWCDILANPGAKLHLYGKVEPRPGRKMGHFSCVAPSLDEALEAALHLRMLLHPRFPVASSGERAGDVVRMGAQAFPGTAEPRTPPNLAGMCSP